MPGLKNRALILNFLLWASFITLWIGLFSPIMTFKKLLFFKNTFSIYSGLVSLFKEGDYIIFLIILAFSVLFPICKIVLLSIIWYFRSWPKTKTQRYLHYLGVLSKWSMLDVFVVAVLVVTVRLGIIGKVEVRWGIYVFAFSVLLSTLAATWLSRIISAYQ